MTKPTKILTFLLLILFVLILYLILTSESAKKIDNAGLPAGQAGQTVKNQATALPAADYQAKVKEIFTAYENLSQDNSLTIDKVAELRNKTLALKGLPAKFKELHLKFVSAMDRMEDYLKEKDQQARGASQKIINQLKADYSWLNN